MVSTSCQHQQGEFYGATKSVQELSPNQNFNVGSTLFQCCRSTLKQRWSDVENESKSHVGFSTLHNVDTTLHLDVETTSKQRRSTLKQRRNNCTKLKQRRNNVAQLRYNFVSTLFLRSLNVVGTISKPIGLLNVDL